MSDGGDDGFAAFFTDAEPRLRRALVAAYGPELGREAASEALAHACQHWDRVKTMANPTGYLYRVGQSKSRSRRRPARFPEVEPAGEPWAEPGLPGALETLSDRERVAVVLIEGFGWTYREVAELVDVSVSSVQSYVQRGMAKLRDALGVSEDA